MVEITARKPRVRANFEPAPGSGPLGFADAGDSHDEDQHDES